MTNNTKNNKSMQKSIRQLGSRLLKIIVNSINHPKISFIFCHLWNFYFVNLYKNYARIIKFTLLDF